MKAGTVPTTKTDTFNNKITNLENSLERGNAILVRI